MCVYQKSNPAVAAEFKGCRTLEYIEDARWHITREQKVENKIEKSVIDYIVVCENMLNYILEVSVDDARTDVLPRYIKTRDSTRVVQSDHNILFSKFKIAFRRKLSKLSEKKQV